jgi:hypothetical protein
MAESSLLHPQHTPPSTAKGRTTGALGPSDSSDSGSDLAGGPGLNHDDGLGPRTGNTSDPDVDQRRASAGADIGDGDLDSDTDRHGTGERGAAGRDSATPVDQTLRTEDDRLVEPDALDEAPDERGETEDDEADG